MYLTIMLIVANEILERARFTDESPKIENTTVSFNNGEWYIETPPTYLKLKIAGYAGIKHLNMPIELGEDALLYFHPQHGLILQNRIG